MEAPIALAEARARLLAALPAASAPPRPGERLPLGAALGRVLLEAVPCPEDLPPFDRSLVDGYAVRCADGLALALAAAAPMGTAAAPLPPGAAAPVPTGGMVPAGADAVVMQEDVRLAGRGIVLGRAPRPGDNIVRRGADAARGDTALPAGRRLRPPEIGMLATVGATSVTVWPRLRVAVLSTGDELVPAGLPARPGQVPDSNAPALCAALARDGAEARFAGLVPDERGALDAALRAALDAADAVLCTGGSSVGDRDFVQPALTAAFGAPLFSGIAVRPGRPTAAFTAAGGAWAVALPGHAVSALVVYELLLRDVILRRGGETRPRPRGLVPARLAGDVRAPRDREAYERVRLDGEAAVPLRGVSATIGNLARADGLVRCPAGGALAAGADVLVELLD